MNRESLKWIYPVFLKLNLRKNHFSKAEVEYTGTWIPVCRGEGKLRMSTKSLEHVRRSHYNLNALKLIAWIMRAVRKFLSVICYTELTTSLESSQSVSYLELPNPLFVWFSLSGMPSQSLSLLISTGINLLTLTSKASFVFDPQAGSACNILLLSCATHHVLSHCMRI